MTVQTGRISFRDGIAFNSVTQDDFTINVNPATGVNPTVPTLITTQAEATAYGAFATIPAVVRSLPQTLRTQVTIQLADGIHQLGDDLFGDLAKFNFEYSEIAPSYGGALIIKGLNWVIAPGTSNYTVQSVDSVTGTITLNADPGLSVDQVRAYILLGVSGTGAGSYRPIRSHTGITWKIAGDIPFGVNSVVQVVSPASIVRCPVNSSQRQALPAMLYGPRESITFSRFDLVPHSSLTNYPLSILNGEIHYADGFRAMQVRLLLYQSKFRQSCCVLYNSVTTNAVIYLYQGSSFEMFYGVSRPILAYCTGNWGIYINAASLSSRLSSSGGLVIDGPTRAAIYLNGPGASSFIYLSASQPSRCSVPYVFQIINGADCQMQFPEVVSSELRGTTNDVYVDGNGYDWSTIDSDDSKTLMGRQNSRVSYIKSSSL